MQLIWENNPMRKQNQVMTKGPDKKDDQAIRTFLHQINKRPREKIGIKSFKCRGEIIVIQMKERRDNMQPDSQGHKDPEK